MVAGDDEPIVAALDATKDQEEEDQEEEDQEEERNEEEEVEAEKDSEEAVVM